MSFKIVNVKSGKDYKSFETLEWREHLRAKMREHVREWREFEKWLHWGIVPERYRSAAE